MQKNQVLVRKINHLTDARYFAAMGVEWMSIGLSPDPASFAFWHAIRDWVEGVKLVAEPDMRNEDVVARTIIDAKPDGIVKSGGSLVEMIPTHIPVFYRISPDEESDPPETGYLILPYEPSGFWEDIAMVTDPERIFLEAEWTVEWIEAVLAGGYTGGFCFRGGEEEQRGVRDYEKMDVMLGMLERI